MAVKVSRRLVIDASVARSCGGKDATYPTSVNCRDFLQAVLDICHRVVMTPDIREEWDRHQSRFARAWLRSMVAKRKLEALPAIPLNDKLWTTIEQLAGTDKEREEMIKDLRLVEAAIATDKTVISLDQNTARKLFSKAAIQIEVLQGIVWVNPDQTDEQPIEWLHNGAEPELRRILRA